MECVFKIFSDITNDAQNMNGGSTIMYRSLVENFSAAVQIQLKIRTQEFPKLKHRSTEGPAV